MKDDEELTLRDKFAIEIFNGMLGSNIDSVECLYRDIMELIGRNDSETQASTAMVEMAIRAAYDL